MSSKLKLKYSHCELRAGLSAGIAKYKIDQDLVWERHRKLLSRECYLPMFVKTGYDLWA